jgi:hypothetical protein
MKKVILTLVIGLFFVTFSNAQSKTVSLTQGKEDVKKAVVKKADAKTAVYSVNKTDKLTATAEKKSCAGMSKATCATKKKSCEGKSKAECDAKKDKMEKAKKASLKKTM